MLGADLAGVVLGDDGVEDGEADAGKLDLDRGVRRERLAGGRVVVAAHVVEAVAERGPVGIEEGLVLVGRPMGGQVALHHDDVRSERLDLGDGAFVHRLRIRRLARL